MKKEYADKWVAALRSGKYVQGKAALKQAYDGGVKHCCLGVLCEVMGTKQTPPPVNGSNFKFEGEIAYLPDSVVREAGLKSVSPNFASGVMNDISWMNDARSVKFPELADLIEQNWEFL
jgi:hypothetical protein